jgi:hypothetical protein
MTKALLLGWVAFLSFQALASAAIAEWPAPNDGAGGIAAAPTLAWSVSSATNILDNGGFEDGTNGWTLPATAFIRRVTQFDGFNIPFEEGTNLLSLNGGVLSREVALPATGSPIIWTFGVWPSQAIFTADVRSTDGKLLKRADFSQQGVPFSSKAVVDLSAFSGQTVRLDLAFNGPPGGSSSVVDDVRVEVLPDNIEFNIYTAAAPANEFTRIGRTSKPFWPLHNLTAGGAYSWRVDVVSAGQTNIGPTWSFRTAARGTVTQLRTDPLPFSICPDTLVATRVWPADRNGFRTTGGLRDLALAAVVEDSQRPQALIAEVNVAEQSGVEFINAFGESLDLSGWRVEFLRASGTTSQVVTLPESATLEAGAVFTLKESEASDQWPRLRLGEVGWSDVNTLALGVVLRDRALKVIDCVFVDRRSPTTSGWGTLPTKVSLVDWAGPVITNLAGGKSFQRMGNRDRNRRDDWTYSSSTMDVVNPDLQLPFAPGYSEVPIADLDVRDLNYETHYPLHVTLKFPRAATNAILLARAKKYFETPTLYYGASEPFNVVTPGNCLWISGTNSVREDAGTFQITIGLSSPAAADISMRLQLSTNAIIGPAEFVFPRGATEYVVELSVPDNNTIEGTRWVKVSISTAGYSVTDHSIAVHDDESTSVKIVGPSKIREGAATPVFVELGEAPVAPIPISVRMEPRVENSTTPVTFPANTNRAAIWIGYSDNRLAGNYRVKLSVEILDWPITSAEFDYIDTTPVTLTLNAPDRLMEGVAGQATFSLGAVAVSNTVVTLQSSRPDLISVPSEVTIEPNGEFVKFNIAAPANTAVEGYYNVDVTASVTGAAPLTKPIAVFAEELTSGEIVSANLSADQRTLQIRFSARPKWSYTLTSKHQLPPIVEFTAGNHVATSTLGEFGVLVHTGPEIFQIRREPPPP